MSYNKSPKIVEEWADTLDLIALHVHEGEELKLKTPAGTTTNAFTWQIYNALASAQQYPRNNTDKSLKDRVKLRQEGENVIALPKGTPREIEADIGVKTWEDVASSVWGKEEALDVRWVVQENTESEHNLFCETLKHQFEEIAFISEEKVGKHIIRHYHLTPRKRKAPTKKEYYEKKKWDPLNKPSKEEIEELAERHFREIEEELGLNEDEDD